MNLNIITSMECSLHSNKNENFLMHLFDYIYGCIGGKSRLLLLIKGIVSIPSININLIPATNVKEKNTNQFKVIYVAYPKCLSLTK